MKTIGWLGVAAVAMATAAEPAFAQRWYAGASYSSTRSEVDEGRIAGDLQGLGFFSASTSSDTRDSGGRFFVGCNVLPWLDAEIYYADLGKTKWDATVTPPGTLSASIKELESVLGVQLVERDKRSVRLTEVGAEVVARARGVLAAATDLAETAPSEMKASRRLRTTLSRSTCG